MEEIVNKMDVTFADFMAEAEKAIAGNKSAARRARKLTLDLENFGFQFRRASIEAGHDEPDSGSTAE